MKGFMSNSPNPLSRTGIHGAHAITVIDPWLNSQEYLHPLPIGIDIGHIGFIRMPKTCRPTQCSVAVKHTGTEQKLILSITVHTTTTHVMCALASHDRVLLVTIPAPKFF